MGCLLGLVGSVCLFGWFVRWICWLDGLVSWVGWLMGLFSWLGCLGWFGIRQVEKIKIYVE
jgi:hypothetical protein